MSKRLKRINQEVWDSHSDIEGFENGELPLACTCEHYDVIAGKGLIKIVIGDEDNDAGGKVFRLGLETAPEEMIRLIGNSILEELDDTASYSGAERILVNHLGFKSYEQL